MIEYNGRMAAKMGLQSYDKALAMELLRLMYETDADFTNTFRALASISADGSDVAAGPCSSGGDEEGAGIAAAAILPPTLAAAVPADKLTEEAAAGWAAWLGAWRAKLRAEGLPDAARWAEMKRASPKFIPRQHLLQVRCAAHCRVLHFVQMCLVRQRSDRGVHWQTSGMARHGRRAQKYLQSMP